MSKICIKCNGTGEYRGQGFMMADCDLCYDGYIEDDESIYIDKCTSAPRSTSNFIDRRSKEYKKAIIELQEINPGMPRDEVVKMFDEIYNKE
jgi:hypothetical protein